MTMKEEKVELIDPCYSNEQVGDNFVTKIRIDVLHDGKLNAHAMTFVTENNEDLSEVSAALEQGSFILSNVASFAIHNVKGLELLGAVYLSDDEKEEILLVIRTTSLEDLDFVKAPIISSEPIVSIAHDYNSSNSLVLVFPTWKALENAGVSAEELGLIKDAVALPAPETEPKPEEVQKMSDAVYRLLETYVGIPFERKRANFIPIKESENDSEL